MKDALPFNLSEVTEKQSAWVGSATLQVKGVSNRTIRLPEHDGPQSDMTQKKTRQFQEMSSFCPFFWERRPVLFDYQRNAAFEVVWLDG